MRKQTTFIIIPHNRKEVKTISVSSTTLWIAIIALLIVAVIIIYSVFNYSNLLLKARRVDALKRRNEKLEEEHRKILELEERLAFLQKEDDKIRAMLGIDKNLSKYDPSKVNDYYKVSTVLTEDTSGKTKLEKERSPEMAALFAKKEESMRYIPYALPLSGWVSRGFSKEHSGIDIVAPIGTPITSTANGVVTFSGWDDKYGNLAVISHGDVETFYGHNYRNIVKEGDSVERGDIIAFLGSTGKSTGPHLHYEIRVKGTKVDPFNFVLK